MNQQSMWIMIAGPYSFGTKSEEEKLTNLHKLNQAALEVFRKGHTPVIGVNMALPMIETAGKDSYSQIMMPLSLSLCNRCDAILRIGGVSPGADKEVAEFQKRGKVIYQHFDEIPNLSR
jgi:hypothetical protein